MRVPVNSMLLLLLLLLLRLDAAVAAAWSGGSGDNVTTLELRPIMTVLMPPLAHTNFLLKLCLIYA